MKILLISSSPRKESRTLMLAQEVLRGCNSQGMQSETVLLRDLKIKFCTSCEACHKKIMYCPVKDDVNMLLKKMLDADGIILASPNYINQVTASMKAVFDRSSHFIHCLRLSGKYIAGAISSGSGYDESVLSYMKHYANICGAWYAGGVSSSVTALEGKMSEAFNLGSALSQSIKEKKEYPEQKKIIEEHKEHFGKLIQMRKDDWTGEYEYWREKGWL